MNATIFKSYAQRKGFQSINPAIIFETEGKFFILYDSASPYGFNRTFQEAQTRLEARIKNRYYQIENGKLKFDDGQYHVFEYAAAEKCETKKGKTYFKEI